MYMIKNLGAQNNNHGNSITLNSVDQNLEEWKYVHDGKYYIIQYNNNIKYSCHFGFPCTVLETASVFLRHF